MLDCLNCGHFQNDPSLPRVKIIVFMSSQKGTKSGHAQKFRKMLVLMGKIKILGRYPQILRRAACGG